MWGAAREISKAEELAHEIKAQESSLELTTAGGSLDAVHPHAQVSTSRLAILQVDDCFHVPETHTADWPQCICDQHGAFDLPSSSVLSLTGAVSVQLTVSTRLPREDLRVQIPLCFCI